MPLPTNGTPIGGLQELMKLTADKDTLIIQTENGTKQMRASLLCQELFELLCGNSAQAHNAIFRGKNLTDIYTEDELSAKIQANDWSDLYIGDYIEKEITTEYGGTEKVRLRFAHFDYFLGTGDTEITKHHIVMVPEDCFITLAKMNASGTTEGGYVGSAMHTTVLPVYAAALKGILGADHIQSHRRYLTTTVNTSEASAAGTALKGTTTSAAWTSTELCLMSEAMLYGGAIFSSGGRDIADACCQFALFVHAPDMRCTHLGYDGGNRCSFWLSAVASTGSFARCASGGVANCTSASTTDGVRPYLLFV